MEEKNLGEQLQRDHIKKQDAKEWKMSGAEVG